MLPEMSNLFRHSYQSGNIVTNSGVFIGAIYKAVQGFKTKQLKKLQKPNPSCVQTLTTPKAILSGCPSLPFVSLHK